MTEQRISFIDDAERLASPVETQDGRSFEPREYFEDLKSKAKITERQDIVRQLGVVDREYEKARESGQETLANNMLFSWRVLLSELSLLNLGFTHYIYKDDIKRLADKVKPKNAVKFCNWEDFPRIVPDEVRDRFLTARSADLFDGFIVVYSDFTGEDPRSETTKQTIAANKDPVLFGYFEERYMKKGRYTRDEPVVERFSRLYLIASWEDEYCHLTYGKMLELLGDKADDHQLSEDSLKTKYKRISEEQSKGQKEVPSHMLNSEPYRRGEKKTTWWTRFKKWLDRPVE